MSTKQGIKLVIFDMDGTLTEHVLDFNKIRKATGVPGNKMLTLDYIMSLEGPARQQAATILREFENEAAEKAELRSGVREVLEYLSHKQIRAAVQTRNSQRSVDIVVGKFSLKFDAIFTRENAAPKPDPTAVKSLLKLFNLNQSEAVFVGDFWPDIQTGINAGIHTILISNPAVEQGQLEPDIFIDSMHQLIEAIESWS